MVVDCVYGRLYGSLPLALLKHMFSGLSYTQIAAQFDLKVYIFNINNIMQPISLHLFKKLPTIRQDHNTSIQNIFWAMSKPYFHILLPAWFITWPKATTWAISKCILIRIDKMFPGSSKKGLQRHFKSSPKMSEFTHSPVKQL